MTPKRYRLYICLLILGLAAVATTLLIYVINQNSAFFYTPNDLNPNNLQLPKHSFAVGQKLRVGGLVKPGSSHRGADGRIDYFIITDFQAEIVAVTENYQGDWPALFKEGKGVVIEGTWRQDRKIDTTLILAKHDENYVPRSVQKTLDQNGQSLTNAPASAPAREK